VIYFVTGATGFLGGRVVEKLLEQGERVIAYGRNLDSLKQLDELGATCIQAELTNREVLVDSIPLGACVIHCAALSSPWAKTSAYYKTNVIGTQVLASAALERRVSRFIHVSTANVYAQLHAREGIRESDPLPPEMLSMYAKTKLQAELVVDQYVEMGLPAITLRPCGIIGPKDRTIVPRLLNLARKGFIPVMNDSVKVDLVYVDNVVEAILCAANAPGDCIGEKYNISNGEPVQLVKTLEEMLMTMGYPVRRKRFKVQTALRIAGLLELAYRKFSLKGEPIVTRFGVQSLAYTRTLNIEKARDELGYRPVVSLQDGLKRTAQWFSRSGF
jgi:nucleoside-diphosphate-sugar epimerase